VSAFGTTKGVSDLCRASRLSLQVGRASERSVSLELVSQSMLAPPIFGHMSRKPIELPPAVTRAFVKDMRAFFAEKNAIKRDEIAARQLHALKQHYTGKLRLFK
jgi:hypothetical protein